MSLVNRPLLHNYIIHVSSIALGISHTKKKVYLYIYIRSTNNKFIYNTNLVSLWEQGVLQKNTKKKNTLQNTFE